MRILGVDTLEFGIDIVDYNNTFNELLSQIDEKKQLAQQDYKEQQIEINDMKFIVNRKGQGFYAYKIECEQFYICFMSHSGAKNSPIFVRFMSEFLWQYGYEKAFSIFMQWFCKLNVKIIDTRISRLDICLDIDEIEFKTSDLDSFFTRASKIARHYIDSDYYEEKDFSGFTIGRGGCLSCRIYNKTAEIKKSKKQWFKEIWNNNNWNNAKNVWRIEFQIRRKVLKEMQINSVSDIPYHFKELWGYLTQKWLVMKSKSNDTNSSRWKVNKKWKIVQMAEYNFLPTCGIRNAIRQGDLNTLYNACIGSMTSIAAISNYDNTSNVYLDIKQYMSEKNKKDNTTFKEQVEKRKKTFI